MKYRIEYSTTSKRSYKLAQKRGLPMDALNNVVRSLAEGDKLDAVYREQVRLTPDAPGHYTLDLTYRPQATYLLTLTTADGHQHTVRLLKQSDIFGN